MGPFRELEPEPAPDQPGRKGTLLRATRIADFKVDKTAVPKGTYLTFSGTTQRADWERGDWWAFQSHGARLQFRADGATEWTTTSQNDYRRHKAETSGDYRLTYMGDGWSGASHSEPIHVTVN